DAAMLARSRRSRFASRCALALAIATLVPAVAGAARKARLEPGVVAAISGERVYLEVTPHDGESVVGMARPGSDAPGGPARLSQANGGVKRLRADLAYRVPFAMLSAPLQVRAMQALFPADKADPQGWRHTARGESLWSIAQWFAGDPQRFAAIRKANKL